MNKILEKKNNFLALTSRFYILFITTSYIALFYELNIKPQGFDRALAPLDICLFVKESYIALDKAIANRTLNI